MNPWRLLPGQLVLAVLLGDGCRGAPADSSMDDRFEAARAAMVRDQLTGPGRDIRHPGVLRAMGKVPRHRFVPPSYASQAYADHPLPIGHGQTISQPYIVAFMTEQLDPQPAHRVLEVGTGSGYQAAILAELVAEVHSIEIVEPLAESARATLNSLGYTNVHVRAGDGYLGWPEAAPFDAVIVTCAPDHVPRALISQLKEGGRLIIPVGGRMSQELVLLERRGTNVLRRAVLPVRFVPMTGEATQSPSLHP